MRAKIRDTELYFDVEGSSLVVDGAQMRKQPILFAIHGGPGVDHTSYKPGLSALSRQLQIVYFDHRGQGRSARGNPATYTLDNNVEDMEALRQYLGVDSIVVLGASYGGMVALAYAARYPHHLSRLVVVVTAAHHQFLQRAQAILAERGTPEQQRVAQRLWAGSFENEAQLQEYFEVMGPLYSLNYNPEKGRETLGRSILSPDAINEAFRGFLRTYDLRSQLSKITVPTLVLGARHDWICPPEFSEEIAQAIPQAQLQIFEHSGHSIRADQPEAWLQAIREFLGLPDQKL